MQSFATLLFLSLLTLTDSQGNSQAADGPIVPFTSVLPACASNCGPLYDVQGKCAPPNIPAVDANCFCTDTRLTPFDTDPGTTGVSAVCVGAGSCTAASDLQAIKTWYDSYCANNKGASTTTGTGSSATSTSSGAAKKGGGGGNTWLSTHYKWVIMLVIIVFFIVGGWLAACLFRRRYIRKKEKEIEMRPPVAWGPHQLQGMTGGYNYGDGVVDSEGKSHSKEASAPATPANGKRESKGWSRKGRG